MKLLIIIIIIILSSNSYAQNFKMKIHSSSSIAMGYTDISIDGPVNKVLNKEMNGFIVFSIDIHGTLSEGFNVFSWINNIIDFKDSLNSITEITDKYENLINLLKVNWNLGTTIKLDLMKFCITGKKLGYFSIGFYSEAGAGIIVNSPKDIKIIDNWIDIENNMNILIGKGFIDGGVGIDYGRSISIKNFNLGFGMGSRFFHRINIPKSVVVFNKELRSKDDIIIPDFNYNRGWGFGIDLFSGLDFNDKYFNTRLNVEIRNAASFILYNGFYNRDMIQFGLGTSISPLKVFNIENFRVLVDIEFYEGKMFSFNSGMYWKLGDQRFYFTPSIGYNIANRDIWGNSYNSFTSGFSVKIVIIELSGVFEYINSDQYNIGTRFSISW